MGVKGGTLMGEVARKSYDIRFFEEVDYSLTKKDVIVVIPAYEPDEKLINVYKDIMRETDYKMIIVNDGSSNDYKAIFDAIIKDNQKEQGLVYRNEYDLVRYMADRLVVLEHTVNIGKGAALKSAFEFINDNFFYDVNVVTVASDGET